MATKSNIAERRAIAVISIDESLQKLNTGNVELVSPVRTNDAEMRFLLQLEAIAENLSNIAESQKKEDKPKKK